MPANGRAGALPPLAFTVRGDGPPLVMVHGQGTDSHSFATVSRMLERRFTVFYVDCYGHGSSPHDPALYNVVSNGEALAGFVEDEVGRACTVLGHSSGGLIAAYAGMGEYDPRFGEAFFDDSFHSGIPHEDILARVPCPTLFMKARTEWTDDGILLAALDEEDLERCAILIGCCDIVRFDCGHGIHVEDPKGFVRSLVEF